MGKRSVDSQEDRTTKFDLRPVTGDDRDFLLRVYECSREIELAMVPWDEAMKRAFVEHQFDAQTVHYSSEYPTARHDVILSSETGEQVGRLNVNRSDERISILDVTIISEYRRRGIGSAVIAALVDEGRESKRSVQVYVETFNPSQQFFLSRGFDLEDEEGFNLKLVWSPGKN